MKVRYIFFDLQFVLKNCHCKSMQFISLSAVPWPVSTIFSTKWMAVATKEVSELVQAYGQVSPSMQ